MNMLPLRVLLGALALSAGAVLASPVLAADDCLQLGSDQQLVRAGTSTNVLLRNGQDHYVVHFAADCAKASYSRKLTFTTDGKEGQLCGAGRSELRTDNGVCMVSRIEPIDAGEFKRKARQRSR